MVGRVPGCESQAAATEGDPYAGRWVAVLRQRVVAQGGTPAQARAAAQSRFKETPEIRYIPMNPPFPFPPLLDSVRAALPHDRPVYLVGGAVRDLWLRRPVHDFDFAIPENAMPIARQVANALGGAFYPLDPERDTGRVVLTDPQGKRVFLDFARFRGADLDADLEGRDFTVNAMAMDLRSQALFDPLGGMADLKAKCLRACSPGTFVDDPVRILRGVRLAAELGFRIQPETRAAMKAAVPLMARVSAERLRDELFHLFETSRVAAGIRALELLGALKYILPELPALKSVAQPQPHVHDVWAHTLATVEHLQAILQTFIAEPQAGRAADRSRSLSLPSLERYQARLEAHLAAVSPTGRSRRALLFLAALYHDVAKPMVRTVEAGSLHFRGHDEAGAQQVALRARALALSNEEIALLQTLVAQHMRVHFHVNRLLQEGKAPSRRAIYRFFRDCGAAGVDVCLLTMADLRATYEQTLTPEIWKACLDIVALFLESWFEKPFESIAPPALINGDDLMRAFSLPPGPRIGELLEAVREAQAVGEVSTREEALAFVHARLKGDKSADGGQ